MNISLYCACVNGKCELLEQSKPVVMLFIRKTLMYVR